MRPRAVWWANSFPWFLTCTGSQISSIISIKMFPFPPFFTGTTAELTNVEITAEATAERLNENTAQVDSASADVAPLPTSTEAVAKLAFVCCYCGAIEGTGLSLVERLDYVEDAVVKHTVANKKQATLLQYFQPNR
ncbi:hypothetical protein HPB50_016410 [Hyalomma asiaticum]|uniref:Uncharacterized protein n=1 Tax=Hyalomma asiaticum TaxID=266040 RepID=A0ACB7TNQ2_HYAAI|nr:hypothetical protein HPB50_016410 [Hyalomma asiaticum]